MVEVDASKELVSTVEIRLPTGVVYHQVVAFEFAPKYCTKCKSFGHKVGDCNNGLMGRIFTAYVPKRKLQPGGLATSRAKERPVGVVMRPLGGKQKVGEASVVKQGVDLAVNVQSGPSGSATMGDEPAVSAGEMSVDAPPEVAAVSVAVMVRPAPAVGVVQVAGGDSISGGGLSGGGEGDAVSVAPPLCPADGLVTNVQSTVRSGKKGKKKKRSGQQDMAAVRQQSDGEGILMEPCPYADLETSFEGWNKVGKKGKRKK